eukprot:m.1094095 g.1094095  ORF g.1094095 m.1094095 type:complete len:486 (+) comp24299_c1_seq4:309-1766(+)
MGSCVSAANHRTVVDQSRAHAARVESLQVSLNEVQSRLATSSAEQRRCNELLASQQQSSTAALSTAQDEIFDLRTKLDENRQTHVKDMREMVQTHEKQIKHMESSSSTMKAHFLKQIDDISNRLHDHQTNTQQTLAQLNNQQSLTSRLQEQLVEAVERIADLEDENQTLSERNATLHRDFTASEDRLQLYADKLRRLTATMRKSVDADEEFGWDDDDEQLVTECESVVSGMSSPAMSPISGGASNSVFTYTQNTEAASDEDMEHHVFTSGTLSAEDEEENFADWGHATASFLADDIDDEIPDSSERDAVSNLLSIERQSTKRSTRAASGEYGYGDEPSPAPKEWVPPGDIVGWAVDQLGARVHVQRYGSGVLRWVGTVQDTGAQQCGVELDVASGKHDGAVASYRYFDCASPHGVLVDAAHVSLMTDAAAAVGRQHHVGPSMQHRKYPIGEASLHGRPWSSVLDDGGVDGDTVESGNGNEGALDC